MLIVNLYIVICILVLIVNLYIVICIQGVSKKTEQI
jgi:hypothetical protein